MPIFISYRIKKENYVKNNEGEIAVLDCSYDLCGTWISFLDLQSSLGRYLVDI